ncbi:MAG: PAS domain-containing protein, partial [Chitinivibrionales bacterium]|nr:PAS domain-containing protein [Chitinivibrionales bacterium]MBD3356165.1 PAS domain-containing protein [Chitinivibrionales bacterium]
MSRAMEKIVLIIDDTNIPAKLRDLLEPKYHIAIDTAHEVPPSSFDICIVDRTNLERSLELLMERKRHEEPVLLPVLAVGSREDVHYLQRYAETAVNEFLTTPLDDAEVGVRIAMLLRARRLSRELRRCNDAAREEEQPRLPPAVEARNVGLWEWDIQSNEVFFSRRWKRQIGYEEHEIPNRLEEWKSRIHPDDLQRVLPMNMAFIENLTPDYAIEYRFRHKDGSYRRIQLCASVVHDKEGRVERFLGMHMDVTERKREEEVLKGRLRFCERIAGILPLVIYVMDLRTRKNTYINREVSVVLGFSPEHMQAMGEHFIGTVMHQDDRPRLEKHLKELITLPDGAFKQFEYRMRAADGTWRWIMGRDTIFERDDGGVAKSILGTALDITERKRTEEKVWEQRRRLANIIEGTRAGTWEWNVQTGETVFNERWAEMVGYSLSELVPITVETWRNLMHPDDLSSAEALLARHFSGELPYYECEMRLRHKDGRWIWVLDRGKLVSRTPEGKPLMMFGTHIDITALKV